MGRFQIPTYWSTEQALSVAYFLESILQGIWETYGNEMRKQYQVRLRNGVIETEFGSRQKPSDPKDGNQ